MNLLLHLPKFLHIKFKYNIYYINFIIVLNMVTLSIWNVIHLLENQYTDFSK